MANTANSNLTTDFNVTPYYDDYDETKGFYRILYKPGFAVQARELTQMQTILQKQIDRFGRHFFDEGSIVVPGLPELFVANSSSSIGPVNYVKVDNVDSNNSPVIINNFNNITLRGLTSGVNAVVRVVRDTEFDAANNVTYPKTLFVDYTSVANTATANSRFSPGETLVSNVGNLKVLSANTNPIGYGSLYRISSGVIFSKGHFVYFPEQEIVLDRYNPSPTCKGGFKVFEYIVNNSEDITLLDPALEASNYTAPGADRFKLVAELQRRDIDDTADSSDFIPLFTIEDGLVKTFTNRTFYSIIKDEFARRTFYESGDYYVNGLGVELREHFDNGSNGGLLPAPSGNANLISVRIEPGVAFVKGYEVGSISPTYMATDKASTYDVVNNQLASAFLGSYITVNEMIGRLEVDRATRIDLYDTAQDRLSTGKFTDAQTGQLIGSANVVNIEYNSGTIGTPNGRADLYLMDIRMLGSNSFSNVRSIYIDNVGRPDFGADVVLNPATQTAVINEPFNSALLYYTGSDYTRKVRDENDIVKTKYIYSTTRDVSIDVSGGFTVSPWSLSHEVAYTGPLSTTDKREIFLNVNQDATVPTGWSVTSSGTTVMGTLGSTFFDRFNVGDKVEFAGVAGTYTINSITNSWVMIINTAPPSNLIGNALSKVYKNGDYIDLTSIGLRDGLTRNVEATSTTQLRANLRETFASSVSGTATFRVLKQTAQPASKDLISNAYVRINCESNLAGTAGPYNLGLSDVFKIKSVIKKTSSFPTSNTDGTDVTSQFSLDNGQRDTHYDHARLIAKTPLQPTDRLLVELDYFVPNFSEGKGHFSIESYPINDTSTLSDEITTAQVPIYKSPTTGKTFDLRNYLDFRPIKTPSATNVSDPTTADINPIRTFTYYETSSTSGMNSVAPSTELDFDYTYYLGRKDVVHINKENTFSIKRGIPSANPTTPEFSDNEMALAVLNISPYPSISPYYAKLIGRQDIASTIRKVAPVRHTMREIGVLKERVQNLEYYAALSLLEKNALDMVVLDENDMDRFKNGIFVDTFTDHLLGETSNEDYRIVVDPEEKSIRPMYSMQSLKYDFLSGSNVRQHGDMVTLDYDEVLYANIVTATSKLTTEKSTYKFIGNMTLVPSEDVWIDTVTLPPNTISINDANLDGMQDAQQVGGVTITWNAWQTNITGYKVYRGVGTGKSKTAIGTFATRAQAEKAAQNLRTTNLGATIETVFEKTRTGAENFTYADADATSIGSRVVNTEIVPYIRPQTLMGSVTGLKPFTPYTVYFDSINVSAYTRPITKAEFDDVLSLNSWTYNEGDSLRADQNGELWFRLRLPNSDNLRFTVGSKVIRISDVDVAVSSELETSYAEKTFFAQGTIQTKQDTILSTRQVEIRQVAISQSTNYSTFDTLPPLPPPPPPPPEKKDGGGGGPKDPAGPKKSSTTSKSSCKCCLGYVLPIKAETGEEGVFITSIDVFCAEKHPTLGVWFEIRECDAGGNITLNQVPLSEKWFTNAEVQISTNGRNNPLKITFDAPLFLYADKSYALVIHPEAGNPNYYFWVSEPGLTDRVTEQPVTGRTGFGTMFTTNNNVVWVPLDLVDLTCKWYRASFRSAGNFTIGNVPKEKMYLSNIEGNIEGLGEPIVTGDILTLSGGTADVNDMIIGETTSVNGKVLYVSSGKYAMSNIRYSADETVTIRFGSNGEIRSTSVPVSTIENGRGFLDYYKEAPTSTQIILSNSNGGFKANDRIYDISDSGSAKIDRIEDLRYSLIDFEPAMLSFSRTASNYNMTAYSNASGSITSVTGINLDTGENYEFGTEMHLLSRSNENSKLSGARSNRVQIEMTTSSNFLSPVFDLLKTQSIIVDNLINSNTVGENATSGGQLFNKYISKIVTLAEGQDAEDLRVYTTAYRPPNTDVKVWVKLLNGEDSDTMAQRPWIEMEKTFGGDITYSSSSNKDDFKEYTFTIPSSYMTSPNVGAVQYTNTQQIKFTGFKSYQVKVGLLGTNSAIVPRVADLRTIALQM